MYFSNKNVLTNNKASNNSDGIQLYYSGNNTVTSNNVSNNVFGISSFLSNSTIYLNNFINNIYNVYSYDSTNTWNSVEKIIYPYNGSIYANYLGNYWDDYNGTDDNKDGTGDTSYVIPDDNNDSYPLMVPFGNYFAYPNDTILPVVTIVSPINGSIVSTPNVTLAGYATDEVGIVAMSYGHTSEGDGGGGAVPHHFNASTNVSFNWTVGLDEGLNTITVMAIDIANNSGNASVVVTCNYSEEAKANLSIDYEKREITIKGKSTDSDKIDIAIIGPEGVKEGSYIAAIYSPGRDGCYGVGGCEGGAFKDYLLSEYDIESLVGSTQEALLGILDELTVGAAGSDDLVDELLFNLEIGVPFDVTIKKGYLEILNTLGSADTIVENAIRKYLIDKCVERIEKSKREIEGFERKYDCSYAEFITKISNEEGLKAVEKVSPNWEGDLTEWEYWQKELEEWKMRLEDILMKINGNMLLFDK